MFQKITKNWFNILFMLATLASVSTLEIFAAPFMVCTSGSNLIVNGDAEADQTAPGDGSDFDVSGWDPETGAFTIVRYGTSGFPAATDPGPVNRGNFFFEGGTTASSSGSQIINVADCAAQIDAGNQSFTLSGFLGGYQNQDDNAQLTITFRNATNNALGTASIGPVLAADRGNVTGLLSRTTNGIIPIGTRTVEVILQLTRTSGTDNDGYADNLSFVLTSPTAALVSIGGRVLTSNGRGIGNVRVLLTDSAANTQIAFSNTFGFYRFAEVAAGETYVLTASGKRYQFADNPRVLFIGEDNDSVNFTAVPQRLQFSAPFSPSEPNLSPVSKETNFRLVMR